MDMKYSMGRLSGSLKVKYKTINAILGDEWLNDWNGGFDVFIDLDTLFTSSTTSKKYMAELPFSEGADSDMVETILTTLLHWKNFMRRRENTRIFLISNAFELMCSPERGIQKTYLVPWENKYNEDRYKQITYYWNESLDVIEKIYVPYYDLLLGCDYTLVLPNKKEKKIALNSCTPEGKLIKLYREGIKYNGQVGDYYIEVHYQLPTSLTAEERKHIESIKVEKTKQKFK